MPWTRPHRDASPRRDVHDLARVAGRGRGRPGRDRARRRRSRLRRGGADRPLRRVGGVRARVRRGAGRRARRRSVRARRDPGRLPREQFAARAAIDAALHDLQGKLVGLPVLPAARACGATGPPTSWTIWLGDPDDMARRAERTVAAGRFRRLKLKLGAARRPRPRARPRGARRHRPAAPGRRERVLVARRGARVPARRCDVQYCEQPLPAGDPDGAELKRALADPDLRRRGLPHARRRRGVRRARARDQHQAREVGRHPRGGAHGARGARARASA